MQRAVSLAPVDYSPASHLVMTAKYLLAYGDELGAAATVAEVHQAPDRVRRMLKSLGRTDDASFGSVLADWHIASDAWFSNLAPRAAFFNMLGNGLRRIPLNTKIGSTQAQVSAQIVDEGAPIPVTSLTLAGNLIPISKAAAMIVLAKEVARLETQSAVIFVNQAMSDGVVAAVDGKFFDVAMAGATSISSSGNGAGDIDNDLREILNAVNTTGAGRLLWAMSADVANALTLLDLQGTMSPTGGVYRGVEAVVSPAISSGTLRLLNAAGFAGDALPIELTVATQADVDLNAPPDSPVTASTVKTNLWVNNLSALRAVCPFGVKKIRDDAAAEITGITWGDSP